MPGVAKTNEMRGKTKMARIMVVDDEPEIAALVETMLRDDGHAVAVAANGREAIALIEAGGFDLVITDILMPEMEGVETLRAIKSLANPPKVIAMSGGGKLRQMDFLDFIVTFGAAASIAKPFRSPELRALVRKVLDGD